MSASLNTGNSNININDDVPGEENGPLKANLWDKFMGVMKGEDAPNNFINTCFHQYVISQGSGSNVVPVISHAYKQATWPLTEDFSRTCLLLYKYGLKKYDDAKVSTHVYLIYLFVIITSYQTLLTWPYALKGEYPTHVAALEAYLGEDNHNIPMGVIKNIQRAVVESKKKVDTEIKWMCDEVMRRLEMEVNATALKKSIITNCVNQYRNSLQSNGL
jgi:hypothetical protein